MLMGNELISSLDWQGITTTQYVLGWRKTNQLQNQLNKY
jgi:hypothetical protein